MYLFSSTSTPTAASSSSWSSAVLHYLLIVACLCFLASNAQLDLCQLNCESSDRIVGATRMTNTLPHPWAIASFPSSNGGFCKLGCQLFYTEVPRNTTCKRLCSYFYRHRLTSGYNDLAEEAKLECQDGCDIALQICQAGYYCNSGLMIPCPPGTYREAVTNISIIALEATGSCTNCPYGRYRSTKRGKSANDCTKCPKGTYANVTGSVIVSDCQRCPAGQTAEEEGMQLCKCITGDSCDLTVAGDRFFINKVDYFRETIPFIGRW
jgi:hypothetical protein